MIAPSLQLFVQLLLHMMNDLCAEQQYFRLLFCGDESPDSPFNAADERLHKALLIHELESHVLNGGCFFV